MVTRIGPRPAGRARPSGRTLLAVAGLFAAGLIPPAAGSGPHAATPDSIAVLESAVRRHDAPDSLRYRLALAHLDAGTVHDRWRALELFETIRRTYWDDPAYHRDVASVYARGGRLMDARNSLERAITLDPADGSLRVGLARVRLREFLAAYDGRLLPAVLDPLREAVRLDPNDREALLLLSLALHLAKEAPGADVPVLTAQGAEAAERVLRERPDDPSARVLLAVHALDLNQFDRADREFQAYLLRAPTMVRDAYLSLDLTGTQRMEDYSRALDDPGRARFVREYWRRRDPTPLTAVNESRLEIWKRMAVADFLFGDADRGVYGWETDPGEVYVRYGPPSRRTADPGNVTGDSYGTGRFKPTLVFTPPSWSWEYAFPHLRFRVGFEDVNLSGRFAADARTRTALRALRRVSPAVFHEAPDGGIQRFYLAVTDAGPVSGTVREELALGIPPWPGAVGDWWADARLTIVLRDSAYARASVRAIRPGPDDVYRPLPGTEVLILTATFDLAPGRYLATVTAEDPRTGLHGAATWPVIVPGDPGPPGPTLGRPALALALGESASGPAARKLGRTYVPNPMGIVGDRRNLVVYYSVRNLAVRRGEAAYAVRYTVLPAAYLRAFDRHVRSGSARAGSLVDLAASGMEVGDVPLSPRTYSDLRLPAERLRLEPGATLPRGARVDVGGLAPGEYALLLTVTDLTTGNRATARTPFTVMSDEGLKAFLAAR